MIVSQSSNKGSRLRLPRPDPRPDHQNFNHVLVPTISTTSWSRGKTCAGYGLFSNYATPKEGESLGWQLAKG
jgi:hypothetical protein